MGAEGVNSPAERSRCAAAEQRPPGTPAAECALAVDAGNSKIDVAVLRGDGSLLGAARGGGFQPQTRGAAAAVQELAATVRRAVAAAGAVAGVGGPTAGAHPGEREGAPPDRRGGAAPADGTGRFAHLSACLANADLPREERELAAALAAHGWAGTLQVANDTFAVLRAGLPDREPERSGAAVAVVCGAGINCVAQRADGRTHRFPALGELSGDWGGGLGLARAALWHAARAADGRGQRTALARVLPDHFGLPDMFALIEALHTGELAAHRQHELVPVLFTAADRGDAVALHLVHRQAEEIRTMVQVALDRLDLAADRTPVLLGGGVLAARQPLLHRRLVAQLPLARVVTAPPVLGSGLLALDRLGAPESAHAKLRAAYG